MKSLLVIKIGGQIIDDPSALDSFLNALTTIETPCILIHGGGKLATRLSEQLGIETKMIDGRRVTDAATLEIVKQVYGGSINKQIVAFLLAKGKNAIGVTGADADLVRAEKRKHPKIDYGFVGDITSVNTGAFEALLEKGLTLVIAPLTHDGRGQLLNTNADTMAQSIAVALSHLYPTRLIYGFERSGVLQDLADEHSVIRHLRKKEYLSLREGGVIHAGMIPKLDNAFQALDAGVKQVIIGNACELLELLNERAGTTLSNE